MWQDFIDLLFPRVCILCYRTLVKQENFICLHCLSRLPYTYYWKDKCNPAAQLFWGKVQVDWVIPYLHFTKKGIAQEIVHQIKYSNGADLAEFMGSLIGNMIKDTPLIHANALIPVPLHKIKFSQRGYNQSESIAIGISNTTGIPVWNKVLERTFYTETQTRKGRFERWMNVKDAFNVSHKELIHQKHLILIDDVLTTGATLESCVEPLLTAGATNVSIVTLAKAELV